MSAKSWRLHPALVKLLKQIDAAFPNRSKRSDGTIGDERHSAAKSDHNPNAHGIVTAMDITHDPPMGVNCARIAEILRVNRDPRIKYVIYNRRIFSSIVQPWTWRTYTGSNPHTAHMHISVGGDEVPWKLDA